MRDPENVLNSLQEHSAQSGYVYDRLYRNLFNREFFLRAYQNIYASQGNMTAGTDGKTIDAMSLERIDRLIATLKDESYQPKPSRRTYIPKKNGKLRPLGIPSIDDKLVQEVVRMLLESIYENSFEDASHGFRPDRSCHTALRMIQNRFTRCKWFVEGDIKGFFDNIDHNVMIGILRKRIKDERFLRLIRKFLNAGYMEDNQLHQSYSGTPQGGIISPILANIYLDQFDKYMAEYKKRFDRGNKRAVNVEYHKLSAKRIRLKRKLAKAQSEEEKQSLLESIRELDKEEDMPHLIMATPDDYFRDIKAQGKTLPVVSGELFHHSSGCYSAHSEVKRLNRLAEKKILSTEQAHAVDKRKIERFFASDLYKTFMAENKVRREFKFSVLVPAQAYFPVAADAPEENVLLQGVIDCLIETRDGFVILDFKTDHIKKGGAVERAEQYRPQLAAYARAVHEIYGRPVRACVLYFFHTGDTEWVSLDED